MKRLLLLASLLFFALPCFAQQQLPIVNGQVTVNLQQGFISFAVILNANATVTFTNPNPGQVVTLIFTQDSSGNRTVSWAANIHNTPTISSTANATTAVNFVFNTNSNSWSGITGVGGGGAGNPGGSSTQVQYNNGGVFGGMADLTYVSHTITLGASGIFAITAGGTITGITAAMIPTLNQNTTGTSGGLSGSPAITVSSCTGCGSGPGTGTQYEPAYWATTSTLGSASFATTPNGVPQVLVMVPSGSALTAPVGALPGVVTRVVGGTTSTDTIVSVDCSPGRVAYQGSVAVAVTLPTATTLAVPSCVFRLTNTTSGSATAVTVTPTTWTVNGGATLVIAQGRACTMYVDPAGSAWDADCADLPIVAGTNVTITRGQYGPTIAASGSGSGTVTSIATTAPLGGGTITTSGTLTCTTCVTSAASLTSTALMTGGGSQASQTPSSTSTLDSSGNAKFPGSVAVGSSPPAVTPGTGGVAAGGEGTAPSVGFASGVDALWADSTGHCYHANFNNVDFGCVQGTKTIISATNCSSSASPAVCGSAAAGSVVIAASATTVVVNTSAVTANSQIFVFPDETLGTKLSVTCNSTLATAASGLAITARTAGTSFTISTLATVAVNPVCLSYLVTN